MSDKPTGSMLDNIKEPDAAVAVVAGVASNLYARAELLAASGRDSDVKASMALDNDAMLLEAAADALADYVESTYPDYCRQQ